MSFVALYFHLPKARDNDSEKSESTDPSSSHLNQAQQKERNPFYNVHFLIVNLNNNIPFTGITNCLTDSICRCKI